jgi:molecular chaperone DnaK (HSP70)
VRDNYLPQRYGQACLCAQEWRYVVTIPAIWKEEGKALTRQAVSRATNVGEGDIILIKEPEAAALWLTSVYTETLATADYFLKLCDAGGRTVVMSRM